MPRERLAQAPAGAHQCPAGAEARDERVDPVEVGCDLRAGSLVVRAHVRLVGVLEQHHVPVVARDDLLGEAHRPVRAELAGGLDDGRAVELEQLPPLRRRVRRQHARQLQPAQLRDERE